MFACSSIPATPGASRFRRKPGSRRDHRARAAGAATASARRLRSAMIPRMGSTDGPHARLVDSSGRARTTTRAAARQPGSAVAAARASVPSRPATRRQERAAWTRLVTTISDVPARRRRHRAPRPARVVSVRMPRPPTASARGCRGCAPNMGCQRCRVWPASSPRRFREARRAGRRGTLHRPPGRDVSGGPRPGQACRHRCEVHDTPAPRASIAAAARG